MRASSVWIAICGVALLAACTPRPAEEKPVHIGMATALVDANPVKHWVTDFSDSLKSAGREVRIYPSSTLGTEIERDEQTILGLLQINISSGTDVMQYSDRLKTLRLPFLFDNAGELQCLMRQTEFLDTVNEQTEARGLTVIGIVFSGGMSGLFTTTQAVNDLGDIDNLRIRAMDRTQVATISSWGASAVRVSWEEIQTALQTGIAGGYINPPSVALQFHHERQVHHFLALDAFAGFRFVTASTAWLSDLDEADRLALELAVEAASINNFNYVAARQAGDLDRLAASGVRIVRPTPETREQFRRAAEAIYPSLAPGDAIDDVTDILNARCRPESNVSG